MIMFMEEISIKSSKHNYNVILHDKVEDLIKNELAHDEKYFLIIDSVLANKYESLFRETFSNIYVCTLKGGEDAKSFGNYERVCKTLLQNEFSKKDIIISMGGGTIGDLAGYVASTYKRGIRLVNIPTTTLSIIDSSIGGKNALNVDGVKNAIGSIYPPEKVLIGFDVLETLPMSEYANGLCEALKMGLSLDKSLYDLFKQEKLEINQAIRKSILAKKEVVEKDEMESDYRKVLNFGHTIGHAIELDSSYKIKHGFAVANGILIVTKNEEFNDELRLILKKMGCPILKNFEPDKLIASIKNDKKSSSDGVDLVRVHEIGNCYIEHVTFDSLKGEISSYVI